MNVKNETNKKGATTSAPEVNGFYMASNINYDVNKFKLSVKTKYLTDDVFKSSFVFGKDLIRENIKPSTLDKPTISEYYLSGWKYW